MKYMLMLFSDAEEEANMSQEQLEAVIAAHDRFADRARAAGAYVIGEGLHPSTTATTLRIKGGETLVTDGPFAETKEQLGGFYVIDVPDLDAALKWAREVPYMEGGAIEIRPVLG